jgi:hypothetical protein
MPVGAQTLRKHNKASLEPRAFDDAQAGNARQEEFRWPMPL